VPKFFTQSQLQAIADALGETNDGLTGSEIGHLLNSCRLKTIFTPYSKR
jgi:hypothetical protein